MKTALVAIDVQTHFMRCSPADLPARIAVHITDSNYDLVAFTIFQNKNSSNWERTLHWSNCRDGEDLVIAQELKAFTTDENVFTKYAYSAFKGDGFESYLQAHEIGKLEICGTGTEGGVLATAYEAFHKDYGVKVLFDLSYSRADLSEAAQAIILRNIQTRNDPRPY